MSNEWDPEANEIFASAIEIESSAQRAVYLDQVCGQDRKLRRRVDRLLVAHQHAGDFLGEPPSASPDAPEPQTEAAGTQIGPYKLLQQIGEGGFGVVYMAEQRRPVQRKVALKIIKPGMDTREVIARFEAEQQALAMMDHIHIARVLDAGVTESGRPYFVMELVKGVPITEYCDQNNMPLQERLELFVTVCRAVQHAHQKGVIHRDIKPSNIMVTLHDGRPVPKVIDFGVAKAISHRLTEKTLFTQYGQIIGTPQYMSPEQAEMSGLDVDTRSDVYSLGVLLYEMLTGTTPVTLEQLRSTGFAEIQRVIREKEPPTPSTRLSTLGENLSVVAAQRSTDPVRLRRVLSGELDWIVIKALDKDRGRRYESASAFANDVEAFIGDRPVQARPPSAGYLLGKVLRKHRLLATTSMIITCILLAATAISAWQAIEKHELSLIANRRETEARAAAKRADEARQAAVRLKEDSETAKDAANWKSYVSDMDLVSRAFADGRIEEMNQTLDRQLPDLRRFDWYHWWLSGHLHQDMIFVGAATWSLTASPDGKWVAVSKWPYVTEIYRADDFVLVAELSDSGFHSSFSPDGKLVASPNTEGDRVKIWNAANGNWVRDLVRNGGGGKFTASTFSSGQSAPMFAAGDEKGRITVWDASNWKEIATIENQGTVRGLAITSNGKTLVAGSDSALVAYDVGTWEGRPLLEHAGRIIAVVAASDANLVAVAADGGKVWIWKGESLDDQGQPRFVLSPAPIRSMAISADGHRLVVGTARQNSMLVWDLNPELPKLLARIQGHLGEVTGVAFVKDSDTLWSTGLDLTTKTWDLRRCQPFDTLEFPTPERSRLAYSDRDTLLIMADGDKVRKWNIPDRLLRSTDDGEYSSVAVSTDGQLMAGLRGEMLHAWYVDDPGGKSWSRKLKMAERRWNREFSQPLAVTPRGPTIALSIAGADYWNTEIAVVDMSSGERLRIPPGTDAHGTNAQEASARNQKAWPVFAPDGKRLAVARFNETQLWDLGVDPPALENSFLVLGLIRCLAFSPNGETLAVASEAQNITLCDLSTGKRSQLSGHTDYVTSLAYSHDGSVLISGSDDGTVRMWNAATGQLRSTFTGHRGAVTSVAVSPVREDSIIDSIASRSDDGTIRIWHAATAAQVDQQVDDRLRRVAMHVNQHEWEEARKLLDEAIDRGVNDSRLFAISGDLHRLQRNWKAAIVDYGNALASNNKDALIYKRRAEMDVRDGAIAQAKEDYVKAIGASPLLSTERYLDRIRDTLTCGKEIVAERGQWQYTTSEPAAGWNDNGFDDTNWSTGLAPFGLETSHWHMPLERRPNTRWWTSDIWLRRTFSVDTTEDRLVLVADVNDFAEVFLNGAQIFRKEVIYKVNNQHWWKGVVELADDVKLRSGENVLAVYCQNRGTFGYGHIDVGLYSRPKDTSSFEAIVTNAYRASPDSARLLRAMIQENVRQRNWAKAIANNKKLIDLEPDSTNAWLEAAALLVYTNDLQGYHQLCSQMLERFGGSSDWRVANSISKACLLAPPSESNRPGIILMAEKAVKPNPDGWFALVTSTLTEYRRGNYQAAIDKAQKCMDELAKFPSYRDAAVFRLVLCVKAMAHVRRGELELASADRQGFQQYLETNSPLRTGNSPGKYWRDLLICEIQFRELTEDMARIDDSAKQTSE